MTIYLLDNKIKWKTFKKLNDSIRAKDIVPLGADKVLWRMLRAKQIYCWFHKIDTDMQISIALPVYDKLIIIKDI